MNERALDLAGLSRLVAQPQVARILALLDGGGEETRIVGGAVRDALLGLPPGDVDLATTAMPQTVIARAREAGLTVVPTGLSHGTVTVMIEGTPFEVTTLRHDVDTDGRHATVAFGRDFEADARRRDFTMNALYLGRDATLHDPLGGLPDLLARQVRFIGAPRQRIREDYLRILRLFRFHAAFGEGPLDAAARDAAIAERAGIARLSAERINVELSKLLMARRDVEVLTEVADAGLLERVLGGVAVPARLGRLVALEPSADAVARLAALAVFVSEDVARLRTRLRLSNAATKRLEAIAEIGERYHGRDVTAHDVDALLYQTYTRSAVADALVALHAAARVPLDDPHWAAMRGHARFADIPHLPVTGVHLQAQGVASGRSVGAALKTLQARWIRAGFPRDPAVLAALVEEVARDAR